MKLPDHFMTSETPGGALYDTRKPDWFDAPPLRSNYKWHHRTIANTTDLRACLRAGGYAWPGGYALGFYTADGCILSFAAVLENIDVITRDMRDENRESGWFIIGMVNSAEHDDPLICEATGLEI